MPYDDEDYFLPLEDQRVFGAGIKRKRVPFVPSSETRLATTDGHPLSAPATTSSTPGPEAAVSEPTPPSIGDKYLSIVLSKSANPSPSPASTSATTIDAAKQADSSPEERLQEDTALVTCDICNLPLSQPPPSSSDAQYPPHPHESSLVHQASLPHSHPPSAVDRTRRGYKYLASYGWNPDSRTGLGPTGGGIRVPILPQVKHDTAGLGLDVKRMSDAEKKERERQRAAAKLNAKQVRNREEEGKKKAERLREMFYGSEDLEKYLGRG
ncbi:G-patch domain-containing protein [Coccidioides immitis RS]|uniref:G-patch domain-containing protein n=1 Tax=Coccidioides immitis (strain RS) TaxID=246410 RepID=A0A0E1RY73_COCIM|nr:G-patch domain-containing protein [Coccidioides immitis RS]EAS35369.1 G-patch domain-containing protein [Coccidioides immitis RS]TPX26349.1 hypothetical protein DIZ76_011811 [Coccidioides immitis]